MIHTLALYGSSEKFMVTFILHNIGEVVSFFIHLYHQ